MATSKLILLTLISQLWFMTSAELFSAISDVEYLLETHKRIIDDLDSYVAKEEERLNTLRRHLNYYRKEHEHAMEDIPNYLGNPINAFTIIKRLTSDLDVIEKRIKLGTDYKKNVTISHSELKYPTNEDLNGAAKALTRLQETYKLEVRDLSRGILNGVAYSSPMSVSDCYELGRALYNQRDFKNAVAWMIETLDKFHDTDEDVNFNDIDILEYIAFSSYLQGDVKEAFSWTKKILEKDPNHERAKGNVYHYEKMIAEEEKKLRRRRRGDTGEEYDIEENKKLKENEINDYAKERENYEKLCRGEMDISSEIIKELKCRYLTENHPFLKLAPIKLEQMYINPDIFVFHEVLYDHEIEVIKEIARPRFKRASVYHTETGELVEAPYRVCKSAWLKDSEHNVVARVSRRVADMTGLNLWSAEELQVVNYGIGGQYEPHYDFARKREVAFSNFSGNRIATVLFYMSEVSQGGATVFTQLGLSLAPVRGAAAFWLNLHPSGEGDLSTRHAACPVLRGSKWVSNKWIHQGGQELIKPCNLQYQREEHQRKIPKPVPKSFR